MLDVGSIYADTPPDDPPFRVVVTDYTTFLGHGTTVLLSKNLVEEPKVYDHLQACIEVLHN